MSQGKGKRLKSRTNPEAYEKRLDMVLNLSLDGYSEREIARAVGVNQRTVNDDLTEIKKRNFAIFQRDLKEWQEKREAIATELHQRSQKRRRNLSGQSSTAAVRESREEDKWELEMLQKLGLIYEEPQKVVSGGFDEFIVQFEQREKERNKIEE